MTNTIHTDVCIVGAGPAGSFASLFLDKAGINCLLVDKAKFPRDKICGDGISGWVLGILNLLDEDILLRLSKQPFLLHSHGIRIVSPNFSELDLPFIDENMFKKGLPPGFIARRIDFDQFMIDEVKKRAGVKLLENCEVSGYSLLKDGTELSTGDGKTIHAKLVIFANGAGSKFMKDPGGIHKDPKFTMTGIKTYFNGVTGFHEQNYVELIFLKKLLPGYFWIFPLPGGMANVGVGLDQFRIRKKKINLKTMMLQAIETEPYLKERFKNAEQVTKVEAYGLPLWDKKRPISGHRFMLAGDTASLIDPVTGEGMGHAAITGMLAARQAVRSLNTQDFSATFMKQYDESVYDMIGKELAISSKILNFIKYPWLFNGVINKAAKSKTLQEKLSLAMTDLEVRKKLRKPSLYLKILMGR
ncbi:MAG: geranylgeranyl reductase family protein [Bacteroidales bacterium]|nr:geranylgeranyl reductase family protein [Bacteroidales bacterium]